MLADELLTYLFDGKSHFLAQPMSKWLVSSRRFTAFVDTFKDKIRKKIRTTQDQENLLDLRLELETAYLLSQEKSLNLVYEAQQSEKLRSPDFAVTYTTSLTFMVEVTRLRTDPSNTLADAICSKLGQLLPKYSNVLVVGVQNLSLTPEDLRAVMLRIQQRAENSDLAFFKRYQFRDRANFFQHYYRLSEVILRGANSAVAWINPQAKHPLPGKVRTVLYRSHTGKLDQ